MTGKTHRVGGMVCCFAGYSLLSSKGMQISGVSPITQVVMMYPFALFGSVLPDLDHNADSAPSKDIISVIINRVLHLKTKSRQLKEKVVGKEVKAKPFDIRDTFDARHRSWQTHSDLFLAIFLVIYANLVAKITGNVDNIVWLMILQGMILGIISHMILDMLTPEGIWSLVFVVLNKVMKKSKKRIKFPEKIHLVPSKEFFATDGPWEKIIRFILWLMCFIFLAKVIIDISPYEISFNYYS